jgi:hypothetical protein
LPELEEYVLRATSSALLASLKNITAIRYLDLIKIHETFERSPVSMLFEQRLDVSIHSRPLILPTDRVGCTPGKCSKPIFVATAENASEYKRAKGRAERMEVAK